MCISQSERTDQSSPVVNVLNLSWCARQAQHNPYILTDTTPNMKVIKEEIFGPVASVIKFKTEQGETLSASNLRVTLNLTFYRGD